MEIKSYEVEDCPLKPINGVYSAQRDGSIVHENGKFLLTTSKGCWQIWLLPLVPQGKPHCVTISASDSPVSQRWMYYSTHSGRNDYVKTSRMSVKFYENSAKRLPLQNDEPNWEDSLYDPILQEEAPGVPVLPARQCHTGTDTDEDRGMTGSSILSPLSPVLSVEQLPIYTKPIPHMPPGDLASNWKAEEEYTWTGSRTIKYTNRVTQEVRADKPVALQYQPTVCSFNLKTINRQQMEMFAPAQCIRDLGGHPVKASYDAAWEKVAPYWSSTVAAYDHELSNLHAYIKSLQARQDCIAHREVETNTIIASLEKKLEEAQTIAQELRTKDLASHALINSLLEQLEDLKQGDLYPVKECAASPPSASAVTSTITACPSVGATLFMLNNKNHVLRDAPAEANNVFPCGTEIRAEFTSALFNFDIFACDAVNCLEDAGHDRDAGELFVQVMKSIHEVTLNYVRDLLHKKQELLFSTSGVAVDFEDFNPEVDSVGKLFWYSTQQVQILAAVSQLTEADIDGLLEQMNPLVARLHALMLTAAAEKTIDDSEDSLRIPKLVHFMLRAHAVALLSDPRCYLEPAPGTRIEYRAHQHDEVLSPGALRYGRIKEGKEVEVVFCGLCFRPADLEPPTLDPVEVSKGLGKGLDKPPALVPALVRRVVADGR